jgi:hypothetical protein
MECFEELVEDEFMNKYTRFIPYFVVEMMQRRDQPTFTWETHLHYNYS